MKLCVRLLDASWSSSHKAPRLGCGERCVRQAGLCSTDGGGGGGVGGWRESVWRGRLSPGDPEVGLEG